MLVPESFPDRSICILGLGYVGLTLAATMADIGFDVLGVEVRPEVVEGLRQGRPHFHEPGLEDQLRRVLDRGTLRVETAIPDDHRSRVFIITVGTPLGPDGRARLDMIERATGEVAAAMPENALVLLRSTVRLGTTRAVAVPILETAGVPFDLAFCPERTLEGVALQELRALPQIVGGSTMAATIRAAQLFQFVTPTIVRVRDPETAEMIKLVDNAQRDVQFAYANEVARVCDAIGVSAREVIAAGKLGYPRTNLPMPGPVGGPCLEKDPYILAEGLERYGIAPDITLTARRLNERQPQETMDFLAGTARALGGFPERPVIALMGLAFKGRPATDDLRGTMARPILAALRGHFPDAEYRGYDSVVPAAGIQAMGLAPTGTLADAMNGAHLVVIANNHPDFSAMPIETLSHTMARPGLIYDYWNGFDGRELCLAPGCAYFALGSHGAVRPTTA
ncbi:nucleotide sugar dehydrogenase [Roseospira navarrensis]|uniref:Nucleotide sugar dehydrogenase n=1 Tax=Roseospira navarrensis TaxID=140058 RepID=A0A7X1ZF98_9PROT|nr:nucleotide sugar dehydrogenase [Roseospira navarrensis]MQX37421.1 nucleotide sugar dehydrogenase [Roseospira navarrensis]